VSEATTNGVRHMVGPVLRSGELADAVIEAIRIDNPGSEIDLVDRGAYIRVQTLGRCRLTRDSFAEALGRPAELNEIEPWLTSFAGRINTSSDEITWEESRSGS
jgi:hypothetical protein